MSLFRAAFFFYYGRGLDFTGFAPDIIRAFYMGVRFDASVAAISSIPITLAFIVFLFAGNPKYFKKFVSAAKFYYTAVFGLILTLLCVDFGFYSYFQDRLNIMVFGLFEDDTKAILTTIYKNYNVFLILAGFVLLFAFSYFLSKRCLSFPNKAEFSSYSPLSFANNNGVFIKIAAALFLVFSNALIARGSLGSYAIGVNSAVSSNPFLNKTALNPFFTLMKAFDEHKQSGGDFDYILAAGYQDDIRRAFADYLNKDISEIPKEKPEAALSVKIPYDETIESLKPNVILIVMESFGRDLIKYDGENFDVLGELRKHFESDIVFYNFVPAYHSTDGSIESIISNVARTGNLKLSQSKYAYNKYDFSGPVAYKNKGYETVFLYGGNTAWRNIGVYMENLGFDKIFGEKGMNQGYYGNEWGVYDEFLFDYLWKTLESNGNKKFIYAITTTNHPPYSLPKNYEAKPLNPPPDLKQKIIGKDLAEKRFKTYQYANEMLGRFITKIKNSKYANDTIIAVTGDHNFKNVYSYSPQELLTQTEVPFYLYIPDSIKPKNYDASVLGCYLDIMPTLYNISLSDISYTAMGQNLFLPGENKKVYTESNNTAASKNYAVTYYFPAQEASNFYAFSQDNSFKAERTQATQAHKELVKYVKALYAVCGYMIKQTSEK
jgi:phosphoglycerol transferase MdoB-like AlkP superfamily enzyme